VNLPFAALVVADPLAVVIQPGTIPVTGVAFDTRDLRPGDVFVCRRGFNLDSHAYIEAALQAGAAGIVAERAVAASPDVGVALVPDGRRALAALARCFWGYPDRRLGMVGVTGTDGKTTTTRLIGWMLRAYGVSTGELTTISVRIGSAERAKGTRLTTPEAPVAAKYLHAMVDAGTDWAVLEVASHALALARVDGFNFNRAVVTNVTHEHLDLHGDLAGYRRAKRHLLELLDATPDGPRGKAAVLNADDPVAAGFRAGLGAPVITFGLEQPADVRATFRTEASGALTVEGTSPWGAWRAETPLLGSINAANVAAALACVGSITGEVGPGVAALAEFPPVPGRMEVVRRGQPFQVVVDFAHTPHALAGRLTELRATTAGRLIVVFGSAGEQDRAKRPMLGAVAARLADLAVIADEDPRREPPRDIAEAIVAGGRAVPGGAAFEIVLDRRQAITYAMRLARAGDTVLLTGKGHEPNIIYDGYEIPWNERQAAEDALAAAGYGPG